MNYVKLGHKKKYCWSQNHNQGCKQKGNKEENKVINKSKKYALLYSLQNFDDSWVLDLGASFHATLKRCYFLDYVQGVLGLVYLGDNEPFKILGNGKIKVKL